MSAKRTMAKYVLKVNLQKEVSLEGWVSVIGSKLTESHSCRLPTEVRQNQEQVYVEYLIIICPKQFNSFLKYIRPGAVARSEARPLGMQAAPSSIPTSGTFFRGDLVMKNFLRPFTLFRWFKKSTCQLLATDCALSTGKLPRRLAQEQCGLGNWPRLKWPKICWRAVKQISNQNQNEIYIQIFCRSWFVSHTIS